MLSKITKFVQLPPGLLKKIKIFASWLKEYQEEIILFVGVVLVSLISFFIGYFFPKK